MLCLSCQLWGVGGGEEGNDDDDDERGRNVHCHFFGSGFTVMQWHIPEEFNAKLM